MNFVRRRPWLSALALVAIVVVLLVGSFGIYLAGTAGRLPWQEDPTRIAITPFADIPGFNLPGGSSTEAAGTPSPAADSIADEESAQDSGETGLVVSSDGRRSRLSGAAWPR